MPANAKDLPSVIIERVVTRKGEVYFIDSILESPPSVLKQNRSRSDKLFYKGTEFLKCKTERSAHCCLQAFECGHSTTSRSNTSQGIRVVRNGRKRGAAGYASEVSECGLGFAMCLELNQHSRSGSFANVVALSPAEQPCTCQLAQQCSMLSKSCLTE